MTWARAGTAGGMNLTSHLVLVFLRMRMLSGAAASVSLVHRHRHKDLLLEVSSETSALPYALPPEALRVASSCSQDTP